MGGPIESGFGWHLVYIDTVIPGRVPLFEEVESDVRTTWLNEQKERAWRKSYSDMRAKYKILLPAPPTESMASGGVAAAGKQGSAALREESR